MWLDQIIKLLIFFEMIMIQIRRIKEPSICSWFG